MHKECKLLASFLNNSSIEHNENKMNKENQNNQQINIKNIIFKEAKPLKERSHILIFLTHSQTELNNDSKTQTGLDTITSPKEREWNKMSGTSLSCTYCHTTHWMHPSLSSNQSANSKKQTTLQATLQMHAKRRGELQWRPKRTPRH
jgi:hypothetical protein